MNVNLQRMKDRLNALAQIGGNPKVGWTRLAFTEEDNLARKKILKYMEEANLQIEIDNAGNIIGKTTANHFKSPAVAMGSHIDTVPNGGMFDGTLGVISALEIVQTLNENNVQTEHPLEVIVFANEEGSRFGNGLFGSRAIAGMLNKSDLNYTDKDGITIAQALKQLGLNPNKLEEAKTSPGRYKSYFELHIEQGDRLESDNVQIGLVHTIAGPKWLKCVLYGHANHAGATSMQRRNDALLTASKIIQAINKIALDVGGDFVATVGKLDVFPNNINTIPGKVELTMDIRDSDISRRTRGIKNILQTINQIAEKNYELIELEEASPVKLSSRLLHLGKRICTQNNYPFVTLPSGAAHDAQIMSKITDAALIFIPSVRGVSHCPEESINWQDAYLGTQLMLQMVISEAFSAPKG